MEELHLKRKLFTFVLLHCRLQEGIAPSVEPSDAVHWLRGVIDSPLWMHWWYTPYPKLSHQADGFALKLEAMRYQGDGIPEGVRRQSSFDPGSDPGETSLLFAALNSICRQYGIYMCIYIYTDSFLMKL